MGYSGYIARRYLLARHRYGFISTISRLSIIGLAIGIAALLLTVSVLAGFRSTLQEKIVGFDGHIRLRYFHHEPVSDLDRLNQDLKKRPEIASASPYISHEAMIRAGNATDGVMVEAMPESTITAVLDVGSYIIRGKLNFDNDVARDGILISQQIADRLGVEIGEKVTLFSIDGVPGPTNHPRARQFTLQAIYRTGMSDYDDLFVYVPLEAGQNLFSLPRQAHGMLLMLHREEVVEPFAIELQQELGYPYYAVTWQERHANLFAWLKSQQFPIVIIFGLIALVALFNIMSTLMMIVIEKTRDIGILKAMGGRDSGILRLFVWNGTVIGLVGCTLGSGLALLIGGLQNRFDFISIPTEVYFMSSVPVEFHWIHFAIINGIALILAAGATIYPALKASRRAPVESIVHE